MKELLQYSVGKLLTWKNINGIIPIENVIALPPESLADFVSIASY
jgi:hypothetical protein